MDLPFQYCLILCTLCSWSCISSAPQVDNSKRMKATWDSVMVILSTPPPMHPMAINKPDDFAFRFEYGSGNILDTFKSEYTWDMVVDPDSTIPLALSPLELDSIYSAMREIDLFNYPQYWRDRLNPRRFFNHYAFFIQIDSLKRSFQFHLSDGTTRSDTANSIRALNRMIFRMIESSPKFKSLPEPRGIYLD